VCSSDLVGGLITALLVARARDSQFSSADRTLGAGLGVVRGIVIVALAVLISGMTSLREQPWWKESTLVAPAEVVADGLRVLIPESWLRPLRSEPSKAVPVPEGLAPSLGVH
jgi:membrane protein required for colicin V production